MKETMTFKLISHVTIAIPTYNRVRWLKETLASLATHVHAVPTVEILVVDNHSTDGTAEMVTMFVANIKPPPGTTWRYIHEPNQGASHARNRAVREAKGDVIVYLDDDVLLQPGWLDQLIAPWTTHPEAKIGAIGGEVIPIFPEGCPAWMEGWATPLSLTEEPGPLHPRQMPMSANLVFRREVFDECGGMRPDLGRKGEQLLSGEESELLKRVCAAGWEIWFAPQAVVHHQFPLARLNLRYACQHSYDSARSRVIEMMETVKVTTGQRLGYCLSRLMVNLFKSVGLILALIFFGATGQFGSLRKARIRFARCRGYIYQTVRMLPGIFFWKH